MPLAGLFWRTQSLQLAIAQELRPFTDRQVSIDHQLSSADAPAPDTFRLRAQWSARLYAAAAGASRRPRLVATKPAAATTQPKQQTALSVPASSRPQQGPRVIVREGRKSADRAWKALREGRDPCADPALSRQARADLVQTFGGDAVSLGRSARRPSGTTKLLVDVGKQQSLKPTHPADDAGQAHDDALRLLPGRLRHGLRVLRDGPDGPDPVAFLFRNLPAVVVGAAKVQRGTCRRCGPSSSWAWATPAATRNTLQMPRGALPTPSASASRGTG